MLEEQATHISGARQDEEKQKGWTSGRNSQVVTQVIFKVAKPNKFTTDKTQWKTLGMVCRLLQQGWEFLKHIIIYKHFNSS